MREILFRGFTPDERSKTEIIVNGKPIKGQWVQGSYWRFDKTTYCFKEDYEAHPDNTEHYIVFDKMTDWGLPNRLLKADVIPETVGQYTGFTDKNGKKIFEGDIVLDRLTELSDDVAEVKFCTEDVASCGCCYEYFSGSGFKANGIRLDNCEVIGNIYDNPEFLSKGE